LATESLWRHREFAKLWAAQAISQLGTQVTVLALPLAAALVLGAAPAEMGILAAVEYAPFLLFGLLAGVWVDRLPRRPILIGTDLARALLLASVPVAAALDRLSMPHLYLVGFLVGVMTLFFDVAYMAYLPALVTRDQLVEGNSKLEVSRSIAQIAGPGLAGVLVQAITAPFAIALDALSFLVSGLLIRLIAAPEPPRRPREGGSLWREVREGLGVVFGSPVLRSIALCTATSNLFGNIGWAVALLYLARELELAPSSIGLIFAGFGPGGLIGAFVASRAASHFGLGPAVIGSIVVASLGNLVLPLATGSSTTIVVALFAGLLVGAVGGTSYNVNQVSLRQAITPDHLQGRMNATMRFVVWGTIPVGSLIGGFLAEQIGLRPTLLVGALGGLTSCLWVLFSPVRALREQPGRL
jgi:MFS family permease